MKIAWHFWEHDCCPCCGDAVEIDTAVEPGDDGVIQSAYDGDDVRCCATDGACTWTGCIMVDDFDEPARAYLSEGSECDCGERTDR